MIGDRLTHTVSIIRQVTTGAETDYGSDVTTPATIATPKAAIQSRSEQEADAFSQAGAAVADFVIFLLPTDLRTSDAIEHDPSSCPMTEDLPEMRFEIEGIRNAAGLGHHLEVEARSVGSPAEAEGS